MRIVYMGSILALLCSAEAMAAPAAENFPKARVLKPLSMRGLDVSPPASMANAPAVKIPAAEVHTPKIADIEADEINYDTEAARVDAKGDVVVMYDKRRLRGNTMAYDQKANKLTGEGNLELKDETGNTYQFDKAEMDDKLDHGTVENLQGTLQDNSHVAAAQGVRENPKLMHLKSAVYSPCKLCADGKPVSPLWQVRADTVTMDEEDERVKYRNATLDVKGVPVFYTPYFSHPTPGAKAKSGFLTPSYASSSTLGVMVKTPYYLALAPDKDATIEPIFTTKEGQVLSGDFRQAVGNGKYSFSGSITNPHQRDEQGQRIPGHDLRGHIEGAGLFDVTDTTQVGFDGKRSTDDTYLKRYRFGNEDVLTSKAFVQDFRGHDYIGVQAVTFQGLNAQDDPDTTPYALPWAQAYFEGKTGYGNSRWQLTGDSLVIGRSEGVNSRRISTTGSVIAPYITDGGHVFELATSLRADAYHVDNNQTTVNTIDDGFVGRVIPEVRAGWHMPMMQTGENHKIVLEPVVDVIASPNGNNPDDIPNEDSRDLELSDVNLFSDNRFSGVDRVEGGLRTNYGFRGNASYRQTNLDFLVGQNYRTRTEENFTPQSGLDGNFSDYTGRVSLLKTDIGSLNYRFRLDKTTYDFRRNEISGNLKLDPISLDLGYLNLNEDDQNTDRKELAGRVGLKFQEHWEVFTGGRRDLSKQNGAWINTRAGLQYDDECFTFITELGRDFTRDRDIEPSTVYMVRFGFKNMGDF